MSESTSKNENSKLALLYKDLDLGIAPKFSDRVTVVIVTYNKYEYVKELIKSFNYINYDRDLLDILVVDNASADGTEDKLREDFGDSITLIQTGANLGGSGGFNTGMKYAIERLSNDYVWLLDNDVVIHPDSLNWLMSAMKGNEDKLAAVGSMILQLDNPDTVSEIGAVMDWKKGKIVMQHAEEKFSEYLEGDSQEDKDSRLEVKKIDYCAACSLLKTRKSIEKLGYWEDIFIHFDDVDWCLRAIDNGMGIACNPRSIVFHESMNLKQPTWIKYYNVRNLLYLYKNHKPWLVPFAFLKFGMWSDYFFAHGFFKNSFLVVKALWDFLRNKKFKQDFPIENYQSFDNYDWGNLKKEISNTGKLTCVFHSRANYESFISDPALEKAGFKEFLDGLGDRLSLVFYDEVSGPLGLLGLAFKQCSKTVFGGSKVIFDGAFERYFMFPSFSNKLVVYSLYRSLVDRL